MPWIHFTRTPASTLLLGGQVPDTRGSTLSTGTCVEEGDLAVDTSAFKHMLPCTTSFPSSTNCPGPPQLPPLASQCFHPSRSMCGGMSSLTWGGHEQEGRAKKQRNHQIAHTQRRRQGTSQDQSASSCLLVATFPMTVSSPEGIDERSTSHYSSTIPSPPSHADAQGVASNFPLPSPEGGSCHLGHFCANTERM